MVNQSILLLSLVCQGLCFFIYEMTEDEQIYTTRIKIAMDQFNNINSCLVHGIWTRYNPLSQIPQVGDFSIFDSNCYNIHNVVDGQTEFSNFLYYYCIDYESKTLKKFIQFVDDKQNCHNFQIDLDPLNYENIWFYFGISIFPIRNKVQFIILQNQNQIFFQDLDIIFPYFDKDLKINFGGGLALIQSQRIQTYQEQKIFSYFPGKMYLYQTSLANDDYISYTIHQGMDFYIDTLQNFNCFNFMLETFSFQDIQTINIEKRQIQQSFLYQYHFSGWIKAIEIHQTDEEFLYKLIKISSNSENKRLTNDNLSPFQLLYRFEGEKQFLQILTYSYTIPSINIDFSQNPFLIKKEILLTQNISLWHHIQVQFEENQLKADFTFYGIEGQLNLNFLIDVNHFHYIKFKIELGNLYENQLNYINFRLIQFSFASGDLPISVQGCDKSCQTCDGPTIYDCLSCKLESKRIYLKQSKTCVCPENMVDQDNNCISLENLIQTFSESQMQVQKCQFGYFQFDEYTCVQCPSNPEFNTISCLECIQNPYTWKSQPTCSQNLLYNKSDSFLFQINQQQFQIPIFTFDSTDVQFCKNCQQISLSNVDDLYDYYQQIMKVKDNILKYNINSEIKYCQFLCDVGYSLYNNQCKRKIPNQNYCLEPYYLKSRRQCSLCQIEYCVYCFEYHQNDLSKSTLYKYFEVFEIDEFHSVGCALCNEGFQFNSLLGKCIFQQPQIVNCLRSFINLNGQEVCTLSNLQTFDLSPEINDCQNKIPDCYQCIKTPFQVIKCIICKDGYSANILSGKCQICPIKNSKICIQGDGFERNAWIQLIQSFIMQFLNKSYFYPKGRKNFIFDYVITCQDGYKAISQDKCVPYCNSDCLSCAEIGNISFQCLECPLNNYNQIQRSTDNLNCLKCPKLCSFCQVRTQEEIKQLNPYFIITDENIQYTYKCLQTAFKENTIIDSKYQIAKQVFGNQTYKLNFDFEVQCDYINQYKFIKDFKSNLIDGNDYQSQITINYCNQQGIENIEITIQYRKNKDQYCLLIFQPQFFNNSLKQEVFSLKLIVFVLTGISLENIEISIFKNPVEVLNFDQIKFEFMHFFLATEMYFLFSNQNFISIQFHNVIFSSNLKPLNFKIQNALINHLDLNDITFQQINFADTIVFNISRKYMKDKIFQIIQEYLIVHFKIQSLYKYCKLHKKLQYITQQQKIAFSKTPLQFLWMLNILLKIMVYFNYQNQEITNFSIAYVSKFKDL